MPEFLRLAGIVKRFAAVTALDEAHLTLNGGEVHVLLGANGSGKSTMSKIVAGTVRPDEGRIELDGEPFTPTGPEDSRKHGVAVVFQELSLVPTLSVAHNIMLGSHRGGGGVFLDDERLHDDALTMLSLFEGVVDAQRCTPDATVGDLPPDEQQVVEIVKALYREPKLLILDEATASLHGNQVERLFEIVRRRRDDGAAVVFISHRMEEIYRIGDRATVLRNGSTVGTFDLETTERSVLLSAMVGTDVAADDRRRRREPGGDEPLLVVDGLSGNGLHDVSFAVRRGEVLGLSGLQGQGQTEVLQSLFGAQESITGTVTLAGHRIDVGHPGTAVANGIAYVTGDRKRSGVFTIRSILENLAIAGLGRKTRGFFRRSAVARWVTTAVRRLDIVFAHLNAPISQSSGGNQQKVIIGRWLLTEPRVLLMDDPTKGVDIQTKTELYDLVDEMCADGMSVVWSSSEDRELLQAAHRVLVMREGRVVAELEGDTLNAYELYKAAL